MTIGEIFDKIKNIQELEEEIFILQSNENLDTGSRFDPRDRIKNLERLIEEYRSEHVDDTKHELLDEHGRLRKKIDEIANQADFRKLDDSTIEEMERSAITSVNGFGPPELSTGGLSIEDLERATSASANNFGLPDTAWHQDYGLIVLKGKFTALGRAMKKWVLRK